MSGKATSNAPRALPFRPPQEVAARLRFWTLALGTVGAVSLVVLGAAVVVLIHLASARPAASAPPADDGELREAVRQQAVKKAAPVPAAGERRTPQERSLEALGGLTAAHLYQTYLNLGLLADGAETGTYAEGEAQNMLATVMSLMDTVDRILDRLAGDNLSADDLAGLDDVRHLSALLRNQAHALRAYWATGDDEQADRYHEAREKAWRLLSDLLKL